MPEAKENMVYPVLKHDPSILNLKSPGKSFLQFLFYCLGLAIDAEWMRRAQRALTLLTGAPYSALTIYVFFSLNLATVRNYKLKLTAWIPVTPTIGGDAHAISTTFENA